MDLFACEAERSGEGVSLVGDEGHEFGGGDGISGQQPGELRGRLAADCNFRPVSRYSRRARTHRAAAATLASSFIDKSAHHLRKKRNERFISRVVSTFS